MSVLRKSLKTAIEREKIINTKDRSILAERKIQKKLKKILESTKIIWKTTFIGKRTEKVQIKLKKQLIGKRIQEKNYKKTLEKH